MSRIPLVIAVGTATAVVAALTTGPAVAQAAPARTAASPAAAADALVAAKPAYLHVSSAETFQRQASITSGGFSFVSYTRTYQGLPEVGGDFVVMTDANGVAKYTSVAQTSAVGTLSVTPKISDRAAQATARKQLKSVSKVEGTKLVVLTNEGAAAKLAWQTTVDGTRAGGPSRLTVSVDAVTGKVLSTDEHVTEATGTGTGWVYGSVSLSTTQSGSTFLLQDSSHTTLRAQNASNNATFSGSDNVWGNGNGTNRETGGVDAPY